MKVKVPFLLILLAVCLIAEFPHRAKATSSSPFLTSAIKVLLVIGGETDYDLAGYIVADLARYGYNITVSSSRTTIDLTTDSKTQDLSQYDLVFVDSYASGYENPSRVSSAEVSHFMDNYDGALIVAGGALLFNETSPYSAWANDSSELLKLEARLGLDFTGSAVNIKDSFYIKTNSSLTSGPSNITFFTGGGWSAHRAQSLDGASQFYSVTYGGSTYNAVTYFQNASGAIGIYLAHSPLYHISDVAYGLVDKENRVALLNSLIAYALGKDFNAVINFQQFASVRMDDFGRPDGSAGYSVSQQVTEWNYFKTVCDNNGVKPTNYLIVWQAGYGQMSETLTALCKAEEDTWELASHLQHLDVRSMTQAQSIEALNGETANWTDLGLNQFSTVASLGGYTPSAALLAEISSRNYWNFLTAYKDWYLETDYSFNSGMIMLDWGTDYVTFEKMNFTQLTTTAMDGGIKNNHDRWANETFRNFPMAVFHPYNFLTNQVGSYFLDNWAGNITADYPDIKWLPIRDILLHFGQFSHTAVLSTASQTGSTITFSVNVDNVQTLNTIDKGMLWIRVEAGNTIQSVTIDDIDWYIFDDYSIRIPATNSQITVTLGTPSTPHLTACNAQITTSRFVTNQLTITVNALSRTTTRITIHCGDEGQPQKVEGLSSDGSWSYAQPTKLLSIRTRHGSSATITVVWGGSSSGQYQLTVKVNAGFFPALGAKVEIDGQNQTVNLLGETYWSLSYGDYLIRAYYQGKNQTQTISLNQDHTVGFNFDVKKNMEEDPTLYRLILFASAGIVGLFLLSVFLKRRR